MKIFTLTIAKCEHESCGKEFCTNSPDQVKCCPYCGWDTLGEKAEAIGMAREVLHKERANTVRTIEQLESSPGTRGAADFQRGRKNVLDSMNKR